MTTLLILLVFGFNLAFGIWEKCKYKEKCFNCEELHGKVLQIIESTNRIDVTISAMLGTDNTIDQQNTQIARHNDELHKELVETFGLGSDVEFVIPYSGPEAWITTKWVVDDPGAIFVKLTAKCRLGCKRLRISNEIDKCPKYEHICREGHSISGIGKFSFPQTDVGDCVAEDRFSILGERINHQSEGQTFVVQDPLLGITWSSLTKVQGELNLTHSRFKNIRDELERKFDQYHLNPSPTTDRYWRNKEFPYSVGRKQHSGYNHYTDIYVNGTSGVELLTIVGICGEYTVETDTLYPRYFNLSERQRPNSTNMANMAGTKLH